MAATVDFIAPNCATRVHTFPWEKEPLQVRSGSTKEIAMSRPLHSGILQEIIAECSLLQVYSSGNGSFCWDLPSRSVREGIIP